MMRYSKELPVSNLANCPDEHPSPCEEDRKTDEFLDSVQKKSVSDGIRLRKREEKLQKQDLTSDDKRSLQKKNQREKFIQEVSSDLIQSDTDLAKQQLVTLSLTSSPCKQADSSSFAHLYEKLRDAEDFADRAVQEAIICYCQFGKALIQRRGEIASERQVDPESNAVSRVLNMEVRAQLPADTSDALLWKRIEQAKKLWKLFDTIGMDKIYQIHSFSVSSISKMTNKEIQSNEKNSELSLPDLSSGSDKKNSELSHINTSNASEEQTSSKSGPWSSPCPICNGKHGNYGLHGSWYCENGNQLPYDPELAKLYSQDRLEYCLTCNTSSNKLKFAFIA
ncbi:hypothetical protein F8M41_011220 [Gigaspora margarita]|uniref:Uncharacterized protein n=1 Tax=Gigaspora margarita TaxID=4874 RepID=A0A8H4ATX8_GIGMA|nr:hypothetical protein F8M41_011220 [Gigaspora margarita]